MLDLRILEERTNSRSSVILRAALLTPMALLLLALLGWSANFLPSSFLAVTVLTLGGIPAAIEAISAIRDLKAQPATTRGVVVRLWHKSRYLFVGRVDYMLVSRKLFEINAITATELHEGDEVVVEHWPHTNIVISLSRAPLDSSR